MLIVLFGPDGSGKSTLAKALEMELKRRNLKASISWMRGSHTLASILSKALSRLGAFKGGLNPYYGIAIPRSLTKLWQLLEWASAIPIILARYVLPSAFGRIVIGDRFVQDLIVWIAITTDDASFPNSLLSRHLLSLASRSGFHFLVTAKLEELVRRSGNDPEFLMKQLTLYEAIAKAMGAPVIDTTNKGIDESFEELLSKLGTAL